MKETEGIVEKGLRSGHGTEPYEQILLREAYEAVSKKEYEKARETFEHVLSRMEIALDDTQKALICGELATVLFCLGQYDTAQRYCERGLALSSNHVYLYVLLGKIAVARFDFGEAKRCFMQVPADHPGRGLGLALIAIKLRDTREARAQLNALQGKVDRDDPEYLVLEAYVILLQGEPKTALAQGRKMLAQPGSCDPFLQIILGEIFMTAGAYGEASSCAEDVLKHCPKNDGAWAIKAHSAYADEEFDEAQADAQHAASLNPRNAYAKTILMKCAVRSGAYERAERIGMEILKDSPEYSLAHANVGDVYFVQGRYELAKVEYEETAQLMDSQTKGAALRQARMAFIDEDYRAAATILEKLVHAYHTYYDDAICDLALCYEQLGEEEKKAELREAMVMRRSFYHRTETLLKSMRFSAP